MHTFYVTMGLDLSRERLPEIDPTDAFQALTKKKPEACAAGALRLVGPAKIQVPVRSLGRVFEDTMYVGRPNQLIEAAVLAFDKHYPLVLSPDVVWLCIAHGFATHMSLSLHAEAIRERFVKHQRKLELTVHRGAFMKGNPKNDWPGVFAEFSDQIAAHVGEKKRDLVVAKFSTTGPIEKAASEVVLLDAQQSYFKYRVVTLCGIPRITLLGDADDWWSIVYRAQALGEFDLGWWMDSLVPVLKQIAYTANGAQGPAFDAFWQSFCKRRSESGGDVVTGWINALFPYITPFDYRINARRTIENANVRQKVYLDDLGAAPGVKDFPSGLASAPFTWRGMGGALPMRFVAGIAGIEQQDDLALRPVAGWAVVDDAG